MASNQQKQRWFGMDRDRVVFSMLVAILLTAFVLRIWRLGAYGYGNEYYAAAVKSMLQSWHNFFFIAAEPGGSVMVDKPPLGLWLQAISAWVFGLNGFSLALPSALSGTLSVYILYLIIKRFFNHHAALTSAFLLAVLPGVVWVDRTNLLDSMVVCTNLIAIWFLLNAILKNRWEWLIGSFVFIGLGFNIKMLQAYLILPALATTYFFSTKKVWWERFLHLLIATAVLLVISFSWVLIVDLTPEENRPYVSSTESNRMVELVFGHNGLNRLISIRNRLQLSGETNAVNQGPIQPPTRSSGAGILPEETNPPVGQVTGVPLIEEIGIPGWLRLIQLPLAHQVSWLLPFAFISLVLVVFLLKWKLPLPLENQLFVLMGIWLLTEVFFFSIADFFHAYYLIMLGVPIAALCGIGIWGIIKLWDDESWKGFTACIVSLLITVIFNTNILSAFGDTGQSVKIISGLLAFLVVIGILLCTLRRHCIWRNVALMGLVLFLGSASFLWSTKGITFENPEVQDSPIGASAYISITYQSELRRDQRNLLTFLEENTQPDQYLMMVNNSSAAAPFILASGRSVFTTGGFTGNDPVISSDEIIQMVEQGEIQFILAQRNNIDPVLLAYYQENCQVRVFGKLPEQPISEEERLPLAVFDCRN